jgi:tetratricopeptide (TPR) repeat protein
MELRVSARVSAIFEEVCMYSSHRTFHIVLMATLAMTMLTLAAQGAEAFCGRKSCVVGPSTPSTPTYNIPQFQFPNSQQNQQQQNPNFATGKGLNDQGIAACKVGDYVAAIHYFERALEYVPGDKTVLYNLEQARKWQHEAEQRAREAAIQNDLDKVKRQLEGIAASGVDFDGTKTGGTVPGSGGGLSFMPDAPPLTASGPLNTSRPPEPQATTDASVVDLRDMGDKPLVVDPRKVSGAIQKAAPKLGPEKNYPVRSQDILTDPRYDLLDALLGKWPGQKNPDAPLINPLREPAVAKALYDAGKAQLKNRMKNQAELTLVEKMEADEKFAIAKGRILDARVKGEQEAVDRAFTELHQNLTGLARKVGAKDISELSARFKSGDPAVQREYDAIRKQYTLRWQQGVDESRKAADKALADEVQRFKKEHGS